MATYLLLGLAIAVEVMATLSLRASEGFSKLVPSLLVLGGYGFSFILLSLVLQRGLDVAVVYALWSAAGIVAIAVIGAVFLDERLTGAQVLGMALIVSGVVALELGARNA
ncbi:small multidrug resistance pump [Nocardioides alpinus]|jgi:small multidrug resistance pump|uniref:Multidrug efflux SMR transporter n=2 Tax=Nocardioides TaxID=1839 RepID=A0A4Q2SMR7_9ACTN|nr:MULTISPECIES: SMR family transporter [Nocardioides]PKH38496.1 QacE family quaternary ammonium compound efflux SMR transporter [Nocardioides alpinus]RYC05359.1 multidrug efflux SMR transporter [Nocardioides zhouii]SFB47725.1 small multidrug resistance pump [Nocardioides alpinus]